MSWFLPTLKSTVNGFVLVLTSWFWQVLGLHRLVTQHSILPVWWWNFPIYKNSSHTHLSYLHLQWPYFQISSFSDVRKFGLQHLKFGETQFNSQNCYACVEEVNSKWIDLDICSHNFFWLKVRLHLCKGGKKKIHGKMMGHQADLMFNLRPIEVSCFKRTY